MVMEERGRAYVLVSITSSYSRRDGTANRVGVNTKRGTGTLVTKI